MSRRTPAAATEVALSVLLLALCTSGLASIINQVVWQRALKVYLAGSEAVSSMIVVLVFMAGLGLGSQLMAARAHRIRHPLFALCAVELALAVTNGGICVVLGLDIAESIYAFQRVVVSFGVPLRVLYAGSATVVLVVPCVLMGTTIPLASEALQRQLGREDSRLLGFLFLLNTLGALLGSLVSGFVILPFLGQRAGLLIAISLNAVAGLLVAGLARGIPGAAARSVVAQVGHRVGRHELWLGFAMGLISLAYEMVLFRLGALVFTPRPWVFSAVLAGFLFCWSVGVYLGSRAREQIRPTLVWTSVALAAMPIIYRLARWSDWAVGPPALMPALFLLACLVPCVGFGLLFTQLVTRFADAWGRDVGRYYAYNTLGSCVGIVAVSMVGTAFAPFWSLMLLAAMTAVLLPIFDAAEAHEGGPGLRPSTAAGLAAVGLACLGYLALALGNGGRLEGEVRGIPIVEATYGKSGVIELDAEGNLIWDGLWHSSLSRDGSHIGTANWLLGTVPVFSLTAEEPVQALVIGLGTGITAATVARSDAVAHVDVYEINGALGDFMARHPEGTLNVATHPKVTMHWQDGRSGLALRDRTYGLITQQPLWLIQAGSSTLLSKEYMELVRSRLDPGGVFTIYTNYKAAVAGTGAQARIVRHTAEQVFGYCQTFGKGYMVVCSDRPYPFDRASLAARHADESILADEMDVYTLDAMAAYLDDPRLSWRSEVIVSDDHPVIEYPGAAEQLAGPE